MHRHSLGSSRIEEKLTPSRGWQFGHTLVEVSGILLRAPRLLTPILFMLAVTLSAGTSASFTDDMAFPTQTIVSGTWIPEVSIEIEDKEEDGVYETTPCITLETNIEDTHVYYSFSNDDLLESGTHYTDDCIELPAEEGDFTLSAIAVHDENNDWKSEEEQYEFTVMAPEKSEEKKAKKEDDDEEEKKDEAVEDLVIIPIPTLAEDLILPVEPTPDETETEEEIQVTETLEPEYEEEAIPTDEGVETQSDEEGIEDIIEEV